MTDVADLSAQELIEAFRARRLSPVEAVAASAARIEALEAKLNAFVALCLERAAQEARHAEDAYRAGGQPRPLEGVPFAAKDIFDTAGLATAAGSPMLAARVPDTDAEAVARLRAAGAILVGKTATHEFAWGITSVNPAVTTPRNPVDPDRIAGGSSGGSGAAVASGQVPFALGTDTGGSIRIPASFCGAAGFKPTFGAVSVAGVWPLAPTLDHVGVIAGHVADAALAMQILGDRRLGAGGGAAGGRPPRVARCPDLHLVGLADDVAERFEEAVGALGSLFGPVATVTLPGAERVRETFTALQSAEAFTVHSRAGLFPARASEYGADVRARLAAGQRLTMAAYIEASAERQRIDGAFAALFEHADVVATPISPVAPPPIAAPDEVRHRGETMQLRDCVLPYTVPQDLLGLPSCAVPVGHDRAGLPVGVQLWGRRGADALVLDAAAALQRALIGAPG